MDGQYMFFLLSWWKIVEKGSEKKGERKGERLCVYLKLQIFIDGVLGRKYPTQTICNWQRITQNRLQLTHTQIHSCTEPSISSKTNTLTLTRVQFLRVGFGEMKTTTKYSGIPSRGPSPLPKAFYLKRFQQLEGLFPNLNSLSALTSSLLNLTKTNKAKTIFYLLKYC